MMPRLARIVTPGNVYPFSPHAGPRIGEDAPQAPVTRKGKIRHAQERRLRDAVDEGVKVLILRSGDFFGPAAPNSALVRSAIASQRCASLSSSPRRRRSSTPWPSRVHILASTGPSTASSSASTATAAWMKKPGVAPVRPAGPKPRETRPGKFTSLVSCATTSRRPDVAAAGKLNTVVAGEPEALARVAPLLRPGVTVLVKGSRLNRLERVVDALRAAESAPARGADGH